MGATVPGTCEVPVAYLSLYRKYRPQSFEEVVGQEHVTRTLANAITEDRLHHAYLFTGPRGTGKTSTARILAKAVNCEQGPTPRPCNRCDQCTAIAAGSSVDVIELDMASHGGVDDARELRERALFSPASARTKVYILDEVHMASSAAFNALLKLVEEPPGHVLFCMATTDPQKVLPTIMSRVQRLDLRRVGHDALAAHLRRVTEQEGAELDPEAVAAVVRAGDGSVRDCLSVLDQVLSFAQGRVTGADVAQVLGHTPAERAFEAVEHLAAGDLAGALGLVQDVLDDGHDLRRFAADLVGHLRDLLVVQVLPDRPDLVDASDDRRERLGQQAGALDRETIVRAVGVLGEALVEMRQGPPRLPLELALARIAVPETAGDTAALADRIARLERALAGGAVPPAGGAAAGGDPVARDAPDASERVAGDAPDAAERVAGDAPDAGGSAPGGDTDAGEPAAGAEPGVAPEPAGAPEPQAEPEASPAAQAQPQAGDGGALDLARLRERWPAVLDTVNGISKRIHAIYEPAVPVGLDGDTVTLAYPPRYTTFHARNAAQHDHLEVLQRATRQVLGTALRVETAVADGDDGAPSSTQGASAAPPGDEEDARAAELAGAADLDEEEAAARATELVLTELDAEVIEVRQDPQS